MSFIRMLATKAASFNFATCSAIQLFLFNKSGSRKYKYNHD